MDLIETVARRLVPLTSMIGESTVESLRRDAAEIISMVQGNRDSMNRMHSPESVKALADEPLVAALVRVAGRNNEMDCSEDLKTLRDEVLRRLKSK